MTKNRSEQKGEDEFIQLKAMGTFNITLSVFNCVITPICFCKVYTFTEIQDKYLLLNDTDVNNNPDIEICILTSDWCSFLQVFAY